MSDREFESELKKLNIPYSDESSVSHRTRKYLTNLSFIVADVWRLCDAVEYCREVIDGKSQDPLPDIGRLIHPGEDANRNCICVYMRKLGAQMINYGEGSCPRHIVVIRASQAAATLFAKLKQLFRDRSLLRAQLKIEDLFRLVAYNGKPTHTPDAYSKLVSRLVEDFISNMAEYAEKLEEHIGTIIERRKAAREQAAQSAESNQVSKSVEEDVKAIRKTTEKTERKVDIVLVKQEETRKSVNRLDQRDKKNKKNARRRFTIETQELVFGYWERGQCNATIRRESGKHRVTYEQVFKYYTSELKSLGVKSETDFKSCIKLRSNNIQRGKTALLRG